PVPIYAVVGDDPYLRREVLEAIAARVFGGPADDLGVTRFPGDTASLADVLDEVRTLPFLVKRRIVIVEDADKFVTAHRKELEGYAERPSREGILILAVKSLPSSTRLAKLVDKSGLVIDCKNPAEREMAP